MPDPTFEQGHILPMPAGGGPYAPMPQPRMPQRPDVAQQRALIGRALMQRRAYDNQRAALEAAPFGPTLAPYVIPAAPPPLPWGGQGMSDPNRWLEHSLYTHFGGGY